MNERFVDHDGAYLLSHSVGLAVRGTRDAASRHFDVWEQHTVDAWPRWLDSITAFRTSLAGLIGGDTASICPQSNVSSALTKILSSIAPARGSQRHTILLTEDTFPSLGYVCEHSGFDVRYIARTHDVTDPAVWRDHLGSDIDVALLTHVQSNTGELIPVPEIVEIARAHDTITIVDVAQSVGVIPIDATAWNADFVIGSCVKWLSGGPGAGWMWARLDGLERFGPRDVGWFSHANPFEFDIHSFRAANDALRFWGGTPTVLPFTLAQHSIEVIAAIGVDSIRAHNLALGNQLIDALGARVVSPHAPERRSGTCIIEAGEGTVETLARAGIAVDHRALGIRVSPHVHVSSDDIDSLIAHLR